jgi:hypothetical protein
LLSALRFSKEDLMSNDRLAGVLTHMGVEPPTKISPTTGKQTYAFAKTDEELFNRIKNGKPGRMASFGVAFTDDKIWAIVKFIRSLKPDVDPENPS